MERMGEKKDFREKEISQYYYLTRPSSVGRPLVVGNWPKLPRSMNGNEQMRGRFFIFHDAPRLVIFRT